MKLRNKKTGEIVKVVGFDQSYDEIKMRFVDEDNVGKLYITDSLTTFNSDWEDYEEPKRIYFVDTQNGSVDYFELHNDYICDVDFNNKIGNYFGTKEEAEKAVEKLKAWKRLKDKGFRIRRNNYNDGMMYLHIWNDATDEPTPINKNSETFKDLDLLFGGEE